MLRSIRSTLHSVLNVSLSHSVKSSARRAIVTAPLPSKYILSHDGSFAVTNYVKNDFERDGYIVVKELLTPPEMTKIKNALEQDDAIRKHAFDVNDGNQRKSKLCLWNHPGNDITGMLARSEKLAGTAAALLGGEVYHYHTKLMMKEPLTGGAFVWHQDYGYWYKNGCIWPDMLTAFIAVDRCSLANGCMKVLRGSHKTGRIEHIMVGGQTGADMDRVNKMMEILPLDPVELNPGDCLFFHSNLLHTSAANESPHRRWAFLVAYNRASNNPYLVHHHPQYTPLSIVPNSAILACKNITDMTGKDFLDPTKDKTIKIEG